MSDDSQNQVQFEGEKSMLYARLEPSNKKPALIDFILRLGIVRDEKQANYIVIGFVLVLIAVTVYFYSSVGSGRLPSKNEMDKIPLPGSGIPL